MLRLYRYDSNCKFVKGLNLTLADALSRAKLLSKHIYRPRKVRANLFEDSPDARLEEVRTATENDSNMQKIDTLILNGCQIGKVMS